MKYLFLLSFLLLITGCENIKESKNINEKPIKEVLVKLKESNLCKILKKGIAINFFKKINEKTLAKDILGILLYKIVIDKLQNYPELKIKLMIYYKDYYSRLLLTKY